VTAIPVTREGGRQASQYVCRRQRGIHSQGRVYVVGDIVPAACIRASWVTLGWVERVVPVEAPKPEGPRKAR